LVRSVAASIESLAIGAVHGVQQEPERVDLHRRRWSDGGAMRWWEEELGEAAARVGEGDGRMEAGQSEDLRGGGESEDERRRTERGQAAAQAGMGAALLRAWEGDRGAAVSGWCHGGGWGYGFCGGGPATEHLGEQYKAEKFCVPFSLTQSVRRNFLAHPNFLRN